METFYIYTVIWVHFSVKTEKHYAPIKVKRWHGDIFDRCIVGPKIFV